MDSEEFRVRELPTVKKEPQRDESPTRIETLVIIEWKRLRRWSDVKDLTGEDDYGIYEIVGSHAVVGDRSLLYIGKAEDRAFGERLQEHKDWLQKEWEVEIYVGRIREIDGDDDFSDCQWNEVLSDAERLLIYAHSPPYNARDIHEVPSLQHEGLRIINVGYHGALLPEVSLFGVRISAEALPTYETDSDEEVELRG